jgi:hypothetical protein
VLILLAVESLLACGTGVADAVAYTVVATMPTS